VDHESFWLGEVGAAGSVIRRGVCGIRSASGAIAVGATATVSVVFFSKVTAALVIAL
jgi:hypothetical protein